MECTPPAGLADGRAHVARARPASIRRPRRSPVVDPAADPEAIAVCRKLVVRNHNMIWRLAGRYACRRTPAGDLAQEGAIAICRAILRYDLDGPCRFVTDATATIVRAMREEVCRGGGPGQLKAHEIADLRAYRAAQAAMAHEFDRPPAPAEVAARLGWRARLALHVATLDAIYSRRDATDMVDVDEVLCRSQIEDRTGGAGVDALIAAEDHRLEAEDRRRALAALAALSLRERDCLTQWLGLPPYTQSRSLEEVGAGFDVSKERARQIEIKALPKLRAALGVAAPGPGLRSGSVALGR